MKLTPTGQTPPAITQSTQAIKPDVKARAMAKFMGGEQTPAPTTGQAQTTPVANPNQISAEEFGALNVPKLQIMEHQTAPETSATETVNQEPVQEKPQQDPQLSKQFARLAQQTKLLRQQQKQLETEKAKLEQDREAALEIRNTKLDGYIKLEDLKTNPLGKLTQAGVTYDELTQQILNSAQADPRTEALIAKQEARIAQLEAKLEESNQNYSKQQDEARKAAVRQIRSDVISLVKSDPAYETVRSTKAVNDVVELIERTFDKDGIVLSVEEAAQQVEDYLVEEAMKLTRIGKIKQRLAQAGQPKQETKQTQAETKQTQPGMKTLTNTNSATRPLSARERAIMAFKGQI